jgi:hypothetical protein
MPPTGATTMALSPAMACAAAATAVASRKQPVRTAMRLGFWPPASDRLDPLREGNISLVPRRMLAKLTGERVKLPPAGARGANRQARHRRDPQPSGLHGGPGRETDRRRRLSIRPRRRLSSSIECRRSPARTLAHGRPRSRRRPTRRTGLSRRPPQAARRVRIASSTNRQSRSA